MAALYSFSGFRQLNFTLDEILKVFAFGAVSHICELLT